MANVTIFEFTQAANNLGELTHPADTVTTIDTASVTSLSLGVSTRAVIICTDADCHARFNPSGVGTPATASSIPILSPVPNQFNVSPGPGQTIKFA